MQQKHLVHARRPRQEGEIGDWRCSGEELGLGAVAVDEASVGKVNVVAGLRHRRRILFFLRGRQLQRRSRLRNARSTAQELFGHPKRDVLRGETEVAWRGLDVESDRSGGC